MISRTSFIANGGCNSNTAQSEQGKQVVEPHDGLSTSVSITEALLVNLRNPSPNSSMEVIPIGYFSTKVRFRDREIMIVDDLDDFDDFDDLDDLGALGDLRSRISRIHHPFIS